MVICLSSFRSHCW